MAEIMDRLTAAEAEAFLVREARLLDEGRFGEWLDLFTDDAWYWVPSQPDQKSPRDTVSLIYDDRRLLETRVRRLGNPNMHAQQPRSRTSRIVANVTVEGAEPETGAQRVRSKLQLVEFRRDRQRLFAATCWHGLVRTDGRLRIAWKRIDLVNCDGELDGLVILF
jgi:3-phenylpropionate/cinnamic acid dioxygenase small subunit